MDIFSGREGGSCASLDPQDRYETTWNNGPRVVTTDDLSAFVSNIEIRFPLGLRDAVGVLHDDECYRRNPVQGAHCGDKSPHLGQACFNS